MDVLTQLLMRIQFETIEWILKMDDGTIVDLMEAEGSDPTAAAEIKSTMKV